MACCAKETPEVLEFALELCEEEDPDVEKESRAFKELLVVRSAPERSIEVELDRVALLEKEWKEERAMRTRAEEENLIAQARLRTQEDGWATERERFVTDRRTLDEVASEMLQNEAKAFASRLRTLEETHKDKFTTEVSRWSERVRQLESALEKETTLSRQRRDSDEKIKQRAFQSATSERDIEISRLQIRIQELEDSGRPQREMLELAKIQAQRERLVLALQNRIVELESRNAGLDRELSEFKTQAAGVVPSEYLGPERGDYLRHIVLRYMTFDSAQKRQQLVPVVSVLLNFNQEEAKMCESSAARDVAKEGILGTIANSFQSQVVKPMPIMSKGGMLSRGGNGGNTARAIGPPATATAGKYVPVNKDESM